MIEVFTNTQFTKVRIGFILHTKPIKLMEDLINKHSNKGDKVLDMLFGSATTVSSVY